jgi:hypothetical protein
MKSNYSEFLKQYVYTYHTLGDYYLLSYFIHTCRTSNKRLFRYVYVESLMWKDMLLVTVKSF